MVIVKTEEQYNEKGDGDIRFLPYVDVKLNREEGNDICYRLYGAPVTVKVV